LQAVSIVPEGKRRIDDPASVDRLRIHLTDGPPSSPDLQGAGQTVSGNEYEVVDTKNLPAGPADPEAARFLAPEPFLESDAPEVIAEARKAVQDLKDPRAQ